MFEKSNQKPVVLSSTVGPRRSASPLFLTLAMVTALLALFAVSRHWQTQTVASHWLKQLEQVDDAQVEALIQQISALDAAGLSTLVQATGSGREVVADSARRELASLLLRWQRLSPQTSDPLKATLATSLADKVESLSPSAQQYAASLAQRLLQWPTNGEIVDSSQFIRSCERVFAIAGASRSSPTIGHSLNRAGGSTFITPAIGPLARETEAHKPNADQWSMLPRVDILLLASLPGGDLPIDPLGVNAFPAVIPGVQLDFKQPVPVSRPIERPEGEPRRLYENPFDDPAHAIPGLVPQVDNPRTTISTLEVPAAEKPPNGQSPLPENNDTSAPLKKDYPVKLIGTAARGRRTDRADEVDQGMLRDSERELLLIRALNSDDEQSVRSAIRELRELGFSDTSLVAARDLTDRDPEVRQQLARNVTRLAGINARHWLLWLAEDEDPNVRLTAISLLLTTGDRLLIRQIAERSSGDPDPRIRKQIQRALEMHRQ